MVYKLFYNFIRSIYDNARQLKKSSMNDRLGNIIMLIRGRETRRVKIKVLSSRRIPSRVTSHESDEINVPETVLPIAIRGKRLSLKLPVLASNMTFQ